ncbi:flippase [Priestia megaterium]|uniref:flippase n=1 Tax=Priestia TaxID=2800373 RepID=UPI002453472F|nr:flippase [Priestia megaterium]MDH3182749.1 flippase [Priestia megaterium]
MARNIKSNFIYSFVYQILVVLLPLLTSPYLSRILGPNGLGVYSYTFSLATFFALFGMLGVNNYGNRTIATVQNDINERSRAFWNIWSLQVFMTIVTLIFYGIYLIAYCPVEYKLVSFIQIITIICSMLDINWFFFGMEQFKIIVTRNLIIRLVNVLMIFLLVKDRDDVWLYATIMVSGTLLSNVIVWSFLKKYVVFVRPRFKEQRLHFKPNAVLFVPVIAITLYKQLDKVMLGFLSTMEQVGYFVNAEKIISIPMGIITSLGVVMLPRISFLSAKGKEKEVFRYLSLSMEFVCFMSAAMTFGIAGISKEFAPVFFGQEFHFVGSLIMLISPTIVFISWANVIRTQYLMPKHKDKSYIVSVLLGAIINIIMNIVLIPRYGAMGAVIGTLCAEATVMIYQSNCVKNEVKIRKYVKNGIYYFLAGFVMFIGIRFIAQFGGPNIKTIILEILIGALIYIVLCLPYVLLKHKKVINNYVNNTKGF